MRKSYPAAVKAKIAILALKEEIPLAQLAAQHEVHPTQIRQWKQTLIDALPDVFGDRRARKESNEQEEKARLYEQIGRLQMELDLLKKKSQQLVP